jgi:hypothetical protein
MATCGKPDRHATWLSNDEPLSSTSSKSDGAIRTYNAERRRFDTDTALAAYPARCRASTATATTSYRRTVRVVGRRLIAITLIRRSAAARMRPRTPPGACRIPLVLVLSRGRALCVGCIAIRCSLGIRRPAIGRRARSRSVFVRPRLPVVGVGLLQPAFHRHFDARPVTRATSKDPIVP